MDAGGSYGDDGRAGGLTVGGSCRRIIEADHFMKAGLYYGWLQHLSVPLLVK